MTTRRFFQHPTALVETTRIGTGTRIWAFAHVMKGAHVGRDCNLGDHVFIEAGARLGNGVTVKNGVAVWEGVWVQDGAFLGPNAVFTNDRRPRSPRLSGAAQRYRTRAWLARTRVGRGATIGANATVLCGLTIGAFAMIGAGAVVTANVPAHALWLGVPGRLAGFVCECGERLLFHDNRARCQLCRKRYAARGRAIRRAP